MKKNSVNNSKQQGKAAPKKTRSKNNKQNGVKPKVFTTEAQYDQSYLPKAIPRATGSQVRMSRCALKYANSICRPFAPESDGACIPSIPSIATHKVTGFVRGDGAIGAGGIGWIILSPSLSNDAPTVLHTLFNYSGTSIRPLGLADTLTTGVTTGLCSNLPYSAQQLCTGANNDGPSVIGRIVSAGITIQYTGTALNESGMCYMVRSPNHENISVVPGSNPQIGASISALAGYQHTEVCAFTREKCMIVDFASKYDELNFATISPSLTTTQVNSFSVYPYSGGSHQLPLVAGGTAGYSVTTASGAIVSMGIPTVAILVTGVSGQTFHYEVALHNEYAGFGTQANVTPSDADDDGAAMVLTAANQIPQRKTAAPHANYWDLMYQGLEFAAKRAAPIVVPMMERAVVALLA